MRRATGSTWPPSASGAAAPPTSGRISSRPRRMSAWSPLATASPGGAKASRPRSMPNTAATSAVPWPTGGRSWPARTSTASSSARPTIGTSRWRSTPPRPRRTCMSRSRWAWPWPGAGSCARPLRPTTSSSNTGRSSARRRNSPGPWSSSGTAISARSRPSTSGARGCNPRVHTRNLSPSISTMPTPPPSPPAWITRCGSGPPR